MVGTLIGMCMPEIAEVSKHVMIEQSKQGLNIELMDQNGGSMFPECSL